MSSEYDWSYCPTCSGSGEGRTEHESCWNCGGKGEVWAEVEPDDEPEEEEEENETETT